MTKLWRRVFSLYMLLPAALMLYWVFVPFAANLFSSNTALLDNRPLNHKPEKLSLDLPGNLKLITMILLPEGRSF